MLRCYFECKIETMDDHMHVLIMFKDGLVSIVPRNKLEDPTATAAPYSVCLLYHTHLIFDTSVFSTYVALRVNCIYISNYTRKVLLI